MWRTHQEVRQAFFKFYTIFKTNKKNDHEKYKK